jgi:hypothetical protein
MSITELKEFLWAAGFAGNWAVLGALFYKRHFRNFPAFFALISLGVLRTIWLYCIRSHYGDSLYSHTYYGLAFVDAVVQLLLIYEIARKVFRREGRWAADIRWSLLVWLLASFAGAGILTYMQHPHGDDFVQMTAKKIGFFSVMVNAALFVGLLVLSFKAGLNWRSQVAGIATGMAIYCFAGIPIELAARLEEAQARDALVGQFSIALQFIYLACQGYWVYSLVQPEPSPRTMTPRMEGQVTALRDALVRRNGSRKR